MHKLALISLFVALTIVGIAREDSFSLLRKVKTGDSAKYSITQTIELEGDKLEMKGHLEEKIIAVEEKTFTYESSVKMDTMNAGGEETALQEEPTKMTTKSMRNGALDELTGEDIGADEYRLAQMTTLVVPDKVTKIGDKWTHEWKSNSKNGIVDGKLEFELVGKEKIGPTECLKISVKGKESEGSKPVTVEGMNWIAVEGGQIIKFSAEVKNGPFGEDTVDLTISGQAE